MKAASVPVGFQSMVVLKFSAGAPSGVKISNNRLGRGAACASAFSSGSNGPAAAPIPRPWINRRRDRSNRDLRCMTADLLVDERLTAGRQSNVAERRAHGDSREQIADVAARRAEAVLDVLNRARVVDALHAAHREPEPL